MFKGIKEHAQQTWHTLTPLGHIWSSCRSHPDHIRIRSNDMNPAFWAEIFYFFLLYTIKEHAQQTRDTFRPLGHIWSSCTSDPDQTQIRSRIRLRTTNTSCCNKRWLWTSRLNMNLDLTCKPSNHIWRGTLSRLGLFRIYFVGGGELVVWLSLLTLDIYPNYTVNFKYQ